MFEYNSCLVTSFASTCLCHRDCQSGGRRILFIISADCLDVSLPCRPLPKPNNLYLYLIGHPAHQRSYDLFLLLHYIMAFTALHKWISRTLGLFNVQIWTFLFRTYYLYYWLFDAACAIYIHSWWQAATTASRKIQFSCNLWQDISKKVCSSIK